MLLLISNHTDSNVYEMAVVAVTLIFVETVCLLIV
jgi:hypothetical protein